MNEKVNFFRAFDACVTDACDFLGITRSEFFELAGQWPRHVDRFQTFESPEDFYRGFQGEVGRSNLCANIIDQFTRFDIAEILTRLPCVSAMGFPLTLADVGCGTAALTFPLAAKYGRAYLIDLPNISQDFISFRLGKHDYPNIFTGQLSDIATDVNVMVSLDVLEHISQSSEYFRSMDRVLSPGGLLLLRAPWHSLFPHKEHLPEAEANWREDGGAALLDENYTLIRPFFAGGIYLKNMK